MLPLSVAIAASLFENHPLIGKSFPVADLLRSRSSMSKLLDRNVLKLESMTRHSFRLTDRSMIRPCYVDSLPPSPVTAPLPTHGIV